MEDRTQAVAGGGPQTYPHILGLDRKRTKGETPPVDQSLKVMELAMQDSFRGLTFRAAFTEWLKTHSPFIAPRTRADYEDYGAALCEFLGERLVEDIGYAGVRAYQIWRSRGQGEPAEDSYQHAAGPVRIRSEINCVLKPILKASGFWAEIKERGFRHLPASRDGAGTLISREEQQEILEVSRSSRRWTVFFHVWRVSIHSGCGAGELLKLRRRDVDLEAGYILIILGAKNTGARMRKVMLTPSALESMTWLVARWTRLGGLDRNEFILPHRKDIRKKAGFCRPMKSLSRAWMAIRAEWIRRYPNRANRAKLRFYDARVTAAIRLLQNGKLSLPTIKKALGWEPSSAMVDRYYKPEQEMLREAMNTLEDQGNP